MKRSARAICRGIALTVGVITTTAGAWSETTDLSNGLVVYPASYEDWAVYAYDPGNGKWTALDNVIWHEVKSLGHAGYLVTATATALTTASTYRVVMDVVGTSVEVFMTPAATQRLLAGQTTTLTINLF
jgi:hypothetical protein